MLLNLGDNTSLINPCRVLHIAVAHGKRALVYVLALKMAEHGMLDLKEHKGQVSACVTFTIMTFMK